VVKERLFLDKANSDALYDEITVIDHAVASNEATMAQRAAPPSDPAKVVLAAKRHRPFILPTSGGS
jgi:hypothetical protein